MCARNERSGGSPTDVRDEPESPFLDAELFTGEPEAGWEQRFSALEAESPFLHAFEGFAAHGFEPEAGDEEAEEYLSPATEDRWGEEAVAQLFETEETLDEAHDQFEEFETLGDEPPADELEREAGELLEAWDASEWEAREGGVDVASFEMPAWEVEAWLEEQERGESPDRSTWFEVEDEAPAAPAVAAGREAVRNVPLLARHRAPAPDLIVSWNAMAVTPRVVDVVVHLHGFSMSKGRPLSAADRARRSGLDWSDPRGHDASPGRRRPTVGLIPKGHFYGGKTERGYSFPALLTKTGLQQLIDYGLGWLARRLGVPDLKAGRLILTAHSGGGAALLKILRSLNPHEVHLFDALYQDPSAVVDWARTRLAADRAILEAGATVFDDYMAERGGALRVLYRPGTLTERHSLAVRDALDLTIPAGSPLARWYKVEATRVPHLLVGPRFGWRLLADAGAALPETTPPRPALKTLETREAEWESPDFSEEGWEQEQTDLDDPEVELSEAEATGDWDGVSEEAETPAVSEVVFPSGVSLKVLTGLPVGQHEDYWDPTGSGLPLLDTGPAHKDKKLSANFTVRELTTTGGVSADIARIDPKLVECLQRLRDYTDKTITITSGFRSWARNRAVYKKRGKTPTLSQHCSGRAADINIGGMSGLDIAKAAVAACGPDIGVGLAGTFAHIDVRGCAAAWKYGGQVPSSWEAEVERLQKERGGTRCGAQPKAVSKATTGGPKPPAELTRFAQLVLNAAEGQRLAVDGDYGPRTRKAIEDFRQRHGLGPGSALDGPTQLALAQRALEELAQQSIFPRYGQLDAQTSRALSDFKSRRGLGSDAALDAATRAALADALARPAAASGPPPSGARPPAPPTPGGAPGVAAEQIRVRDEVVAAVERYRPLVDAAAAKYGIESALIRGVIAAESGGNKDLVAKSGYTGLMQAERNAAHKRPEVSIDAGTKKLRDFRSIMEGVLKRAGRRYADLPESERLRLLALAYNAGPVTVAKALQYATEAGDSNRWLDAEHYKRALLFTGAYSLKQAASSCLAGQSKSEQEALIREAQRVWNQWRLGTKKQNWRKLSDPPPWHSVAAGLPPFVVCAIDFKHRNSPKYAAKILAYRERFRAN